MIAGIATLTRPRPGRCPVLFLSPWLCVALSGCRPANPASDFSPPDAAPVVTTQRRIEHSQPPERVTFGDLDCTIQPDIVFREWMLSGRARELDGRRIRIAGFIYPDGQLREITEFVLLKNTECKFGPGGQADHLLQVNLNDGVTTDYTIDPIDVVGVLHYAPFIGPDGNTWAIYKLDGESVGPMQR